MSQTLVTSQNALSTSAEKILSANPGRDFAEVKNLDESINVFVGPDANVTASNGHRLSPDHALGLERYYGELYAIAESGTPSVSIIEY